MYRYKIGSVFRIDDGDVYLLAQVGSLKAQLIGLDGNRWKDNTVDINNYSVTGRQMKELVGVRDGVQIEFVFLADSVDDYFQPEGVK